MAARGTRHATCALALALALGPLGSQRGRASDALRVLVRVVSADDRALLTRLRGQLSDVNVQLIVLEDAALEASLEQQLSAAHALVERHASAAILWAAPGPAAPEELSLYIATRDERVLSRRIARPQIAGDGRAPSSTLELAAVVARAALAALAAGGATGTDAPPASSVAAQDPPATATQHPQSAAALAQQEALAAGAEAQAPPAAAAAPVQSSRVPMIDQARPIPGAAGHGVERDTALAAHPSSVSSTSVLRAPAVAAPAATAVRRAGRPVASRAHHGPPRYAAAAPGPAPLSAASITRDSVDAASRAEAGGRARPLSVRVFIGAQGALDGAASSGQWGVVARAGMESSRFALSAYAVASLASDVADPYFSLRLARHALGAAFDVRVPLSAALELAAGLHGGAALYHRTSSAKSPLAVSHPASLTAAVMFGPEVSLGWMLGRYGVGLVLALDILPRGPRFETAGQGPLGDIQAHTLWVLQPRLSLGMEAALP